MPFFKWERCPLIVCHARDPPSFPAIVVGVMARISALLLKPGPCYSVIVSVSFGIVCRRRALLALICGRTEQSQKLCSKGHCESWLIAWLNARKLLTIIQKVFSGLSSGCLFHYRTWKNFVDTFWADVVRLERWDRLRPRILG